jgi:hypothetical protein
MRRREMLGFVGSGPLAMAALGVAKAEDDPTQEGHAVGLPKDPRTSCFEQCETLAKLCLLIADQCLEALRAGRGDAEALAALHRALADCREFCSLVVVMVLRESPFRTPSYVACAEVCSRCSEVAEKAAFESRDQVVEGLKECAAICREVAQLR